MSPKSARYQLILERVSDFLTDTSDLLVQHPQAAYERAKQIENMVEDDPEESEFVLEHLRAKLSLDEVYRLYATIIKRYENWAADNFSGTVSLSLYSKYADYLGRSISELGLASQLLCRLPENIIIVGSGALPVSAVVLARLLPTSRFDLLDFDPEANRRSQKILEGFSIAKQCTLVEHDAITFDQYSNYELVLVVSSVCADSDSKKSLISQISRCCDERSVVVIRQPFQLEELFLARFHVPKDRVFKEARVVVIQGADDMFQREAYVFGK